MKKKLLVIGGGGREHAIAWKLAQSSKVETVFVAPGNGGTQDEPKLQNVAIEPAAIAQLIDFALHNDIDLTVVGPEQPLSDGIVDRFEQKGLRCLGPTQCAAQLESSKLFAKKFMQRHNIPTASYEEFNCIIKAREHIEKQRMPVVIKADGLTAGKGVTIAHSLDEAQAIIDGLLIKKRFGSAGSRIIVEEYLEGKEVSAFILSDGKNVIPLGVAQDHKQLLEGNHGPNTGGMGAISPVPWLSDEMHDRILHEIMRPTINGMREENVPFVGFLFAGLMVTPSGDLKVLEFNCRLGDPEAQPILLRLKSDFYDICSSVFDGTLAGQNLMWLPQVAVGLVLASQGYPLAYKKGYVIEGMRSDLVDVKIFHAGTMKKNEQLVTSGGRVLCVAATDDTIIEAREKAYAFAQSIEWTGRFYRSDIGIL